jgi:hypothetical protein
LIFIEKNFDKIIMSGSIQELLDQFSQSEPVSEFYWSKVMHQQRTEKGCIDIYSIPQK